MWRTGVGETSGRSAATSKHISYDSSLGPTSHSWRDDDRDDMDCIRGGETNTSMLSDADGKITKFDELLRRIETEREKISSAERTTTSRPSPASRLATIATPPRQRVDKVMEQPPPTPSSGGYDFASRARELRMSDGVPSRSGTPKHSSTPRNGASHHTPRSGGGSHHTPSSASIKTYNSVSTPRRGHTPPVTWRAGNTPVQSSSSTVRSSSPTQDDFKRQVEQFHGSLVSAHETITSLEKDVRTLKKRVDEKDDCISALDRRNKSLNETVVQLESENHSLLLEKNAISKQHTEEIGKIRDEYDAYKKEAGDISKRSSECDTKIESIQKEKQQLESSVQDKDNMISSLRHEIQRLNEELADGSFVRAQAEKAEERAKQIQAELDKYKADHESTTKVIVDLEIRLKEKSEEYNKGLAEKDKEIATLQSELTSGKSIMQCSERMKDKASKLEAQLDESKLENEELAEKKKDLEKRLERCEKTIAKKDEEIETLESSALDAESREKDLRRRLDKEQRELEHQRERFEKYDAGCATEQETVSALEQAIEDLERAHNESSAEIERLQKENHSLSMTLAEAEAYMKMYQNDMKESRKLQSMMGELQDINSDLGKQLQEKDDQVRNLQTRIASIEIQVENSTASSKKAIAQLEGQVAQKDDEIGRLHAELLQTELSSQRNLQDQEEIAAKKLTELTTLFEENESELKQLRSNKARMLRMVSELEEQLDALKNATPKSTRSLGNKLDEECQLEKSQKEAKRARFRVRELEETVKILQHQLDAIDEPRDVDSQSNELKAELAELKRTLAERDNELADARKGISEAQAIIFRLMNTIQELRNKVPGTKVSNKYKDELKKRALESKNNTEEEEAP